MKLYNILDIKNSFIGLLLLGILLTGTINAQQKDEKQKKVMNDITLKVTDENGTPVSKAKVVIGEGIIHAETDENGTFSFKAYLDQTVSVTVPGYEKSAYSVQEILMDNNIKLKKSMLFMTSDDDIPLPYVTVKKRNITGSASIISGDRLEKYPSLDIRNAFSGLVTGLQVTELNGQPGASPQENLGLFGITEKINISARGLSMKYIIDEIPMGITEMQLDANEVESVTIIKDIVGKTMFGPMGANGIIFIKTKRGAKNERIMNVNIEEGISVIDRMPGWTSGTEYAQLQNLARANDGMAIRYSDAAIDAYAKNDPYDLYYPSIDFKSMMLKNTRSYTRANVFTKGGSNIVSYSAYLGYDNEGDIFKIGPLSDFKRFNGRSNVDIQINDLIKAEVNLYGGLSLRNSSNYGYATGESVMALTDILEFNAVVKDITRIPPIEFPVYANNDPALTSPWYGVSNTYKTNPVAALTKNGFYTETGRTSSVNLALDYDLKNLIKGLKSRTLFGINSYLMVRIGKAEDYSAYIATPSKSPKTGNDTILLSRSKTGVSTANLSNLQDYFFNIYRVYENLSYSRSFGKNNIQSELTSSFLKMQQNGLREPVRQLNGVWSVLYSYNDKYSIHGVLDYAGTYWITPEKRFNLFPAAGAGWVISEESFMSNLKFINYLKLRAEAGILGYENFMTPFLYRSAYASGGGAVFGPFTTGQWFGSSQETSPYVISPRGTGNPDLTWEKRKEFEAGIDGVMFNHKLLIEVNYYNNLRDGVIVQRSYTLPYLTGVSSWLPYFNYNKIRLFGLETGIQYTDNLGGFKYSLGGNVTVQNSKLVKYDAPDYRYDYQTRTGKPADTYWGQTCLGKFESDAEALAARQLFSPVLYKGDLKYKDMNGDGAVDDNDASALGHTTPRLLYSINANFSYKNFDMTVVGAGVALYDLPLTSTYFWNGWGDDNYSDFVRDNIGGAYPRLTYNKVNNNFLNSDFWLTNGGYFKIQNVELAYTIPAKKLQIIRSQGVRFFVRGANLLTITKVKDVDPESINSGVTLYPLFKTFSGGINIAF